MDFSLLSVFTPPHPHLSLTHTHTHTHTRTQTHKHTCHPTSITHTHTLSVIFRHRKTDAFEFTASSSAALRRNGSNFHGAPPCLSVSVYLSVGSWNTHLRSSVLVLIKAIPHLSTAILLFSSHGVSHEFHE